MLENKIPEDKVYEMVNEAVFIEKLFVTEIYPVEVIGINSKLIKEYIEYIADNLLISLGYLT
jgi:ribonucleotide reductase beta subunit family protein with ferritin-like domain